MWTIYAIRFHKTGHRYDGRIRYVGQTIKGATARFEEHCRNAKKGRGAALHAAIRKHGRLCFSVQVICEVHSRQEADTAEVDAIAGLGASIDIKLGGLNLTKGGDGFDQSNRAMRARHKASAKIANGTMERRAQSSETMRRTRAINPEPFKASTARLFTDEAFVQRFRAASKSQPSLEKLRQTKREQARTPKGKAQIDAARLAARPVVSAMCQERNRTPEHRAKVVAAHAADPRRPLLMKRALASRWLAHHERVGNSEAASKQRQLIASFDVELQSLTQPSVGRGLC